MTTRRAMRLCAPRRCGVTVPIHGVEEKKYNVTRSQLWSVFAYSAVPMIGFGFMDNMVMIQAGELIDETIGVKFGLATLTAAAFGQIASDVSGICFGGFVEDLCTKCGLKVPCITNAQRRLRIVKIASTSGAVAGVILGCLLGMSSLLFLDLEGAERRKREKQLDPVFRAIMSEASETMRAERATLFVVDEKKHHVSARTSERAAIDLDARTIVTDCVRTRQIINIRDLATDDRFGDVSTPCPTRSVLCVPVASADDPRRCVGVVQIVNKSDQEDDNKDQSSNAAFFSESDVRTAQMLARHLALFLSECPTK